MSDGIPNGIPTRSMENIRWHNPSQVLTAKHVSYPQLTATIMIDQMSVAWITFDQQTLPRNIFSAFIIHNGVQLNVSGFH